MFILIVEDNPDLVGNLYDFLEGRGHSVDSAYDAVTGLRRATEGDYDALVLDLMLPGMDGLDLCRSLRSQGHDIPVLMLTARDTLDDKLTGFDAGADDYLIKPFALPELEARLTALVRRTRGETGRHLLEAGDLTFDTRTLEVRRAGQDLALPRIPLRILEFLLRHAPRVVTRAEIERHVWGDSPPDSDALRSHMHTLRNIVDREFENALIETVHGIGYRVRDTR